MKTTSRQADEILARAHVPNYARDLARDLKEMAGLLREVATLNEPHLKTCQWPVHKCDCFMRKQMIIQHYRAALADWDRDNPGGQ